MQDVAVGVAAPDDWKVTSAQPASAAELDSGQALTTVWTVSVPADTRPGTYTLTSHVTARHGNQADETTSTFDVVVPALPPGGTSNLGDDTWLSATNGYGPVERNTSNGESKAGDGHVMSINGSKYTTGLGAHAPGEITFYLGRQCSNVTTDVGVDDEKRAKGSVTFEIWAHGTKVADSGLMTTADGPRTLSADLTGATILRLVVTDGGNGNDSDHADWAAAQLTCALRPPPAGTTYLSDISCQSAANGWGPVERDESVGSQSAGDGRTLAINGHTYEKGLGTHAPADIRYYLGGACTRMQADVGVDDEVTDNSTLTFQVWADDTKVFDSGLMTWQDDPRAIDADVTGAGTLRLVVTDYDGTNNSDHADWGGARITCGGAA